MISLPSSSITVTWGYLLSLWLMTHTEFGVTCSYTCVCDFYPDNGEEKNLEKFIEYIYNEIK